MSDTMIVKVDDGTVLLVGNVTPIPDPLAVGGATLDGRDGTSGLYLPPNSVIRVGNGSALNFDGNNADLHISGDFDSGTITATTVNADAVVAGTGSVYVQADETGISFVNGDTAFSASLTPTTDGSNIMNVTGNDWNFQAGLIAAMFTGDGSALTSLTAGNLTGTLPAISGSNLTTLNATSLASGTVGTARLGTGTATSTTFLRGDKTWAAPSVSNVNGVLPVVNGGTGQASSANAINALLPTQTSNSGKYLTTNGSTASWATVSGGGSTGANPTASIGLSLINGTATTFMRSDAAPALDVDIVPTWTNQHTFNGGLYANQVFNIGDGAGAQVYGDGSGNLTLNNTTVDSSGVWTFNGLIKAENGITSDDILSLAGANMTYIGPGAIVSVDSDGNMTANTYTGDGSGLTGITATAGFPLDDGASDTITADGAGNIAITAGGTISLTTLGTGNGLTVNSGGDTNVAGALTAAQANFIVDGTGNLTTTTLTANNGLLNNSGFFNLQDDGGSVVYGDGSGELLLDAPSVTIASGGGVVMMPSLPTSDPGLTGQLYNDAGVLKVSAGP